MKRVERIIIKLLLIHLFLLIIAQIFLKQDDVRPFLSKAIRYEGVGNMTITEWVETFHQ